MQVVKAVALAILTNLVWLGLSAIVTALAASAADLEAPWSYLFAVGVFTFTTGVLASAARFGLLLAPADWQKRLTRRKGRARAASPKLPSFLFPTPQQQVTNLIEEGKRLRAVIPAPAEDAKQRLVHTMAGFDVDYPAKVYEWEMRVWRLLSGLALSQWRGFYTEPGVLIACTGSKNTSTIG